MEIPGGGGSSVKASATENPVRTGVKLEKTLRGGGGGGGGWGLEIFWNHTLQRHEFLLVHVYTIETNCISFQHKKWM